MLTIKNLHVSVDSTGKNVDILNGVDLEIKDNEFIVITGPNGGGKTTLAKAVMGIMPITEGSVVFNGIDVTDMGVTERARQGFSFGFQQPPRFKGITVSDILNLASGKKMLHNETCALLNTVGLCAKDYLSREVSSELSGGEIKRIEIASVLARNTPLMIFDEPEAGIDIWSFTKLTETFSKLRDERKSTIIIISHQERIINLADRVALIKNGVVEDLAPPEKLMSKIVGSTIYTCNVLSDKKKG